MLERTNQGTRNALSEVENLIISDIMSFTKENNIPALSVFLNFEKKKL